MKELEPRLFFRSALLLLLAAGGPDAAGAAQLHRHLEVMGTRLTISVAAKHRSDALAASESALAALEAVEGRLSTWSPGTELSRLNASPAGSAFHLSPELRADLEGVQRWVLATDAAFDPAMGALSEAWGLRTGGRIPKRADLAAALKSTGFGKLRFEGSRVSRLPGVTIDEGGFGKGVGLDEALDALGRSAASSAVLDLGGQLALHGATGPVEIRAVHPDQRDRPVLSFTVSHGSVATSGNGEQGMVVDGVPLGHLIDPRSGMPVEDFGSLTVWAPDATTADCLSTGLYVLGPDQALRLARNWEGIEVLVLQRTPNGLQARCTPGLESSLNVIEPGLRLVTEPSSSRRAPVPAACPPGKE